MQTLWTAASWKETHEAFTADVNRPSKPIQLLVVSRSNWNSIFSLNKFAVRVQSKSLCVSVWVWARRKNPWSVAFTRATSYKQSLAGKTRIKITLSASITTIEQAIHCSSTTTTTIVPTNLAENLFSTLFLFPHNFPYSSCEFIKIKIYRQYSSNLLTVFVFFSIPHQLH